MKVLLVFGGRSVEHEVSIRSAATIYAGLLANHHQVLPVGIDKNGDWRLVKKDFFKNIKGHKTPQISQDYEPVFLHRIDTEIQLRTSDGHVLSCVDIAFPIVHGTYGEDGRIQGLFQSLHLPFVGCDVCASACAMDKDITKRILRDAQIKVANWQTIYANNGDQYSFAQLCEMLQSQTLFLKPSSLGSSVGSGIVSSQEQLEASLEEIFLLDRKALVEACIVGREIEFSVLGNTDIQVSLPGEISPSEGFYTYEGKYILGDSKLSLPAQLAEDVITKGQELAASVYEVLGCEGLARVDFFLQPDGQWILNEVNTLPGFTSISMYPQLWEISQKPMNILLEELLMLGLDRHDRQARYRRTLD